MRWIVIYSKVDTCISQPMGLNGHPNTHGYLTGLRNISQKSRPPVNFWQWCCDNKLVYLWNYQLAIKTILRHCMCMWQALANLATYCTETSKAAEHRLQSHVLNCYR